MSPTPPSSGGREMSIEIEVARDHRTSSRLTAGSADGAGSLHRDRVVGSFRPRPQRDGERATGRSSSFKTPYPYQGGFTTDRRDVGQGRVRAVVRPKDRIVAVGLVQARLDPRQTDAMFAAGWWHVTHRRPFAPRSRKIGLSTATTGKPACGVDRSNLAGPVARVEDPCGLTASGFEPSRSMPAQVWPGQAP